LTNSLSLPVCATENPIDPIDRPTASGRLTVSREPGVTVRRTVRIR